MKKYIAIVDKAMEDLQFQCGEPLFNPDVSPDSSSAKKFAELQKNNPIVVNQSLYCHSTLEAIYYSNSLGPLRCYKCGTDVSEIQELITKRDTLLKDYFLVHPSCPECGPNFFKMRKRQRPQAGKQKSVKKNTPCRGNGVLDYHLLNVTLTYHF